MKSLKVLFIFTVFFSLLYGEDKFILRTIDSDKEILSLSEKIDVQKRLEAGKKIGTIERFEVITEDGVTIPAIFFNRNSDKLIFFGHGFGGSKEWYKSRGYLFSDYDVVLFDYRWKNINAFLSKISIILHPFRESLFREKDDVKAVLKEVKSKKQYKEVIGFGECYSSFVFAALQSEAEQEDNMVFDKLIMDSSWLSLVDFSRQLALDPCVPCHHNSALEAPNWIRKILKFKVVNYCINKFFETLAPDISIEKDLCKIKNTSILFLHGSNDRLVPMETFKKIWNATKCHKVALITPFEHVSNVKNSTTLSVCDNFIRNNLNK
jgi:pimeloyl-ACP methyl ester carboxylesterase